MRHVLFTHDMEPITVIDLKPWAMEFLRKRGRVYFAVTRPIQLISYRDPIAINNCSASQVCITSERFIRNHEEHLFLFTHDEETAMLLKSVFLPGQYGAVKERERDAWAKGFMDALNLAARL